MKKFFIIISILILVLVSIYFIKVNIKIEGEYKVENFDNVEQNGREIIKNYKNIEIPAYAKISNICNYKVSGSHNLYFKLKIPKNKINQIISDLSLFDLNNTDKRLYLNYDQLKGRIKWWNIPNDKVFKTCARGTD